MHHLRSDRWTWNGDKVKPTASPSLLIRVSSEAKCHLFIKGGNLEFCGDSEHKLAGKIVPMVPWSEVKENDY